MMRRAKLLRPRLRGGLVPRPRLVRQLDESLDQPLILVVGPAGFGKTTLLGEWLAGSDLTAAWLTLDADDGDLARFVSHFISAVQTAYPGVGDAVLEAVERANPNPEQLGAMLGDELLDLPEDFVLVLDDYQEAADSQVNDLLAALLQYPPLRLHLVLSSRTDPALALARQRGRGNVSEIRAADLRFTVDETRALLAMVTGVAVEDRVVSLLQERTEGWASGLRLASMALHGHADHVTLAEAIAAISDRHVMDFLIEEVLARQPEGVQDFLLRTSIDDRICGDLAAALIDPISAAGAQEMLEQLSRSNLYVEQLDEVPVWYRYHPLFRELLRHRLAILVDAAEVAALHLRASAWFAEQQLIDQAVMHAMAAGDARGAADLVERHMERALADEKLPALERWLRLLPPTAVQERPRLLVARALIAKHRRGASEGLRPLLREIYDLLGPDAAETDHPVTTALRSEVSLLEVRTLLFDTHVDEYLSVASRALEYLAPEQRFARGRALFWVGRSLQASGQLDEAVFRLGHQLTADAGVVDACTIAALHGLAVVHLREGNLHEAGLAATYMLRLATEHDLGMARGWAHRVLGDVSYEQNRLSDAVTHYAAVVAGRDAVTGPNLIESMMQLALAYQAMGKTQDADVTSEHLLDFILRSRSLEYLPILHAYQARLALHRGELEQAIRWLATSGITVDLITLVACEVPLLSRVRILLSEGSTGSLDEATRHLDALSERAQAIHDRRRTVECLALQALAFQAQGSIDQARSTLERALVLAAPKGLVRTLVDLGPRLMPILRDVRDIGGLGEYTARLLSAFGSGGSGQVVARSRFQVYEVLTEREAQILDCLSRKLSNQEIADSLFISPLTVKRHASNIYDKLGVANRRQALLKAERLGLLASA